MIWKAIFGTANEGSDDASTARDTVGTSDGDDTGSAGSDPAPDDAGDGETGPPDDHPSPDDAGDGTSGNTDDADGSVADDDEPVQPDTTSKVATEAEQGTGPAAASATTAATGDGNHDVSSVSVVVGEHGASAASDVGVVAIGPNGAAAANEAGVVAVGPEGGAAASDAANGADVSMTDDDGD